jgi:DNA-binding PadR family transcriptional regulator
MPPPPDRHTAPEAHLPLHPLEFQILLSLARGSSHAYAIVRWIESRQPDWNRILPTNLYRRIWRLESEGLIRLEGETGEGARPRKTFSMTDLGRRVAAAEAHRLRGLLRDATRAGVVTASGEDGP